MSIMLSELAAKEIRKVDEFTVDFFTNGPDPIFPENVTSWYIMDKEWAEANLKK